MTVRLLREFQEGLQVSTKQKRELWRMKIFLDPQELMQRTRDQMTAAEGVDPVTSAYSAAFREK